MFRDKVFYLGVISVVAAGLAANWYWALRVCYDHPPVCTTSIGFPFLAYSTGWNEPCVYLPGLFGDLSILFAVGVVAGLAFSALVNRQSTTNLK